MELGRAWKWRGLKGKLYWGLLGRVGVFYVQWALRLIDTIIDFDGSFYVIDTVAMKDSFDS